jgi:riboflavin synthase
VFTGIVQDLGSVAAVDSLESGRRLTLRSRFAAEDLEMGESIAVSGACMTVVGWTDVTFSVDVSPESLRRTTLGGLEVGAAVNLERSMTLADRIGGHLVSGHIDGTGEIVAIRAEGESSVYTFSIPPELALRTIEKGSIAIDGISLTCFNCESGKFDAALIPHTMQVTTLGAKKPGDAVNIETDMLGKYVERLLEPVLAKTKLG